MNDESLGAARRGSESGSNGTPALPPAADDGSGPARSHCRWCGSVVEAKYRRCPSCLHEPHVPRAACRCQACLAGSPGPALVAGDIEVVVERLRRRAAARQRTTTESATATESSTCTTKEQP